MASTSENPELTVLLRQADFVRRLAVGLLGAGADAEDAVQETWLAALRRPPQSAREGGDGRGWAARVVHNFARGLQRGQGRRNRREEVAARPEGQPSAQEVAADLEIHRRLVQALSELRDPYRTAVVMRFFHGHAPREAARRLGVPVETFKTRLKRGLALLRTELDGLYGDRESWGVLLAPLAGGLPLAAPAGAGTAATIGVGGIAMGTKSMLVVAAALVAAALWTWQAVDGGEAAPPSAPAGEAGPTALAARPTEPSSAGSGDAGLLEAPRVSASPAAPQSAPLPLARGRVTVIDEEGRPYRRVDGTIVLELRQGARTQELHVAVNGGAWQLAYVPQASYAIARMELDGRQAWISLEHVAGPDDPPSRGRLARHALETSTSVDGLGRLDLTHSPVMIVATWRRPTLLNVVDLRSGKHLRDVVLHGLGEGGDFSGPFAVHPDWTHSPRARGEAFDRSPIELAGRAGRQEFWLRAEDHAWRRATLDFDAASERTVALERAGELEIRIAGKMPPSAVLRLYREIDGATHAAGEIEAPSRRARFEGLPAGELLVHLELGESWGRPTVLAAGRIEIRAGAVARLRLNAVLPDALHEPVVPVAGTLRMERALESHWTSLEFAPLAGPALRPGDHGRIGLEGLTFDTAAGVYRWDAGDLSPGTYRFVLHPVQKRWDVLVGPRGDRDVRLEVGELSRVTVELVDAQTGEPVDAVMLSWMPTREQEHGLDLRPVQPSEPGRYVFHAPPGEIRVWVLTEDFEEDPVPFVVGPGESLQRLELEPAPGFVLTLSDEGTVVPVPLGQQVVVRERDGEGTGRIRSQDGPSVTVRVSRPGLYRVELLPVDGYERPEPLEVLVEAGVLGQLEVPLRRLR